MSDLNKVFFNEYSKLDKLCREIYGNLPKENLKGVTNYIDDMKNTPSHISARVPQWDDCLHSLIHIRHIRNHLAHEPGAFNEELCTDNDIQWVHYFHHSILNGTDPLSMARKAGARPVKTPQRPWIENTEYEKTPTKKRKSKPTKKQKRKIKRSLRSILKFILRRF